MAAFGSVCAGRSRNPGPIELSLNNFHISERYTLPAARKGQTVCAFAGSVPGNVEMSGVQGVLTSMINNEIRNSLILLYIPAVSAKTL